MNKYKKISLILLPVLILVVSTQFAHANFIEDIGLFAIAKISYLINYIIGFIGGICMSIAAYLVNWSIDLNDNIIKSSVVTIGWAISRDIANLGFVLAIIFSAFYTILGIPKFNAREVIFKLVIAALLINFSLVIAGVFIDAAGTLTEYFINKVTTNPAQLASVMANSFQIQKFLIPTNTVSDITGGVLNNLSGIIVLIASMFFVSLLTIITAISMAAIAAMFFIRYLYLTILLVLAPLVWVAWIWPTFSSHWDEWWGQFFKWVWFGPVASFFIYLAMKVAEEMAKSGASSNALGGSKLNDSLFPVGLTIENLGGVVGQMAAIIGLLVGGMMAAQRMGIAGSDLALKYIGISGKGEITGKGAVGFAQRRAGGMVSGPAGGIGRWAQTKIVTAGSEGGTGTSYFQKLTNAMAGVPVIGKGVASGLNKFGQQPKGRVEDYEKEMKDWTGDMVKNAANIPGVFTTDTRAAAIAIKALTEKVKTGKKDEKGNDVYDTVFNTLDKEKQQRFISISKNLGPKVFDKLTEKNPTIAGFGLEGAAKDEAIQKAVSKVKNADAFGNVDVNDITEKFVLALGRNQLKGIAASSKVSDKIINRLKEIISSMKDKIERKELVLAGTELKTFEFIQRFDFDNPAWQARGSEKQDSDQEPKKDKDKKSEEK
ncbi:MAG: hypothetical protein PHP03_02120 [Candidatus Pacebacteria bacterium]|nr:hypothetical protein [Candidatus Paceibacterota bacterium]